MTTWRTTGNSLAKSLQGSGGAGNPVPPFCFLTVSVLAPWGTPAHTPGQMSMQSAATSTIRIRLFASFAERLGTELLELPGGELTTVGEVLDYFSREHPDAGIRASTLVAVNLRQAGPDTPVAPGDEVAIMPPLAGG